MTTGEKITALRKQKGISQEELANQMAVSRQAVSKWENDVTVPTNENLVALSQILGTTVSSLMDDEVIKDNDKIANEKKLQDIDGRLSKIKTALIYLKLGLCLSIVIIVLLFLKTVNQSSKINELNNRTRGLYNTINGIYSEMQSIRFLTQDPNSYSDYLSYSDFFVDVTDYDFDTDTRTVKLSIVPDHYDGNEAVRFVLKGEMGTFELPATLENHVYTATGEVKCVGEIVTDKDPIYSITMYVTDGDGNTKRYPLYYDLDPALGYRFRVKDVSTFEAGWGVKKGRAEFNIAYDVTIDASENSCPTKISLLIFKDYEEEPIYRKDYDIHFNGGQVIFDNAEQNSLLQGGYYELGNEASVGTITEWTFSDGVADAIKRNDINENGTLQAYLEFTAQNGEKIRTKDLFKYNHGI